MSWNFILLIFVCITGTMNRRTYYGLTMSTAHWRGTSLQECPEIIKTMHTGFSAYTYCIVQRPGADTEKPDVMIACGKIYVDVLLNISVNSNELSKV